MMKHVLVVMAVMSMAMPAHSSWFSGNQTVKLPDGTTAPKLRSKLETTNNPGHWVPATLRFEDGIRYKVLVDVGSVLNANGNTHLKVRWINSRPFRGPVLNYTANCAKRTIEFYTVAANGAAIPSVVWEYDTKEQIDKYASKNIDSNMSQLFNFTCG
jgi:hypothetical protein